ncbi:MAG: AAA family ATPase [Candidatus Aminicenantes bacterium]|nr:AAA family ATPase [Candidatus Aminicenantes bacterium]NIM79293.1 AAA family ATPase [Candidatus Aminicenantes bacterium]NIN18579.1 AAA family ATPase [Candidatus Aminicenantes bacterium]NIN85234.1 AAA family ATPase [Candidatus Aminicenantes bacterium]NIO81461.1 AAA family ATPase [Candidatus Aminicenantes bacterium]
MDKIKTLFFAASPVGSSGLMVEEEIRAITKKIRAADYRDSIELVPALATRPDDLIEMLNQHKPQIVHFSAHGKPTGEILLLDKVGGLPKAVKSHAIRELFKTMKDNIRVVVLNACYSKVQARAIVKEIDCAIGINIPITNQAAITFAASFYGALGFGRSVKEAYEQGRAAILLEGIDKKNIPELLIKEGVDPSRIFLRPPLLVSQKKRTDKNVINKQIKIISEPSRIQSILSEDTEIHFSDLISYHCSVFAGRNREISAIKNCISETTWSYIFIEGPSGFGKTALLAYLTKIFHNASYHFISQALAGKSALFDPNSEEFFLANLCRQIIKKSNKRNNIITQDLRGAYLSFLNETNSDKEPTIIIIDAVDEVDQNRNFLRGLFPHRLANNNYLIFSARSIGDRSYLHNIGLSSTDKVTIIKLDRFDLDGISSLLKRAGGQAGQWVKNWHFIENLQQITDGDPFYLRFLVEDIRDGLIGTSNICEIPRGLYDYLDLQFELLSNSAESKQQRDILGYILTAKGPLSRSALISCVAGLDPINFDKTIRSIRRFLIENQGEFTFCHERFRQYFIEKAQL